MVFLIIKKVRHIVRKHETWSFFLQVRVPNGITPDFSRFGCLRIKILSRCAKLGTCHEPSAISHEQIFFIRKHETWSFFLQVRVHTGLTPGFKRFGFLQVTGFFSLSGYEPSAISHERVFFHPQTRNLVFLPSSQDACRINTRFHEIWFLAGHWFFSLSGYEPSAISHERVFFHPQTRNLVFLPSSQGAYRINTRFLEIWLVANQNPFTMCEVGHLP